MIAGGRAMQPLRRNSGGHALTRMGRVIRSMLRLWPLALAVLALGGFGNTARAAEDHVALVVGNAHYKNASSLRTPINDAEDIAAAVGALGFDVTLLKDATVEDMREALEKFSAAAAKSNLAVIYFAGHSIAFAGENYLVPIDAEITSESSIAKAAIPLRAATATAAKAKVLGLIILDALRPNSILAKIERGGAKREAGGGSEATDGPRNVISFFAAEAGKTALEIDGRNSPLAKALLTYVNDPNLEINFFFRNVRDDVRK
jgi:uncharacterized caspase-like protein